MRPATFLATLLTTIPTTLGVPTNSVDLYQCGYVLTIHNSSAYAGLSAYNKCAPFFYNATTGDYQDAFAYRLWGGCKCSFHETAQDCVIAEDEPLFEGPTGTGKDPSFDDPRPKWYNCFQTD